MDHRSVGQVPSLWLLFDFIGLVAKLRPSLDPPVPRRRCTPANLDDSGLLLLANEHRNPVHTDTARLLHVVDGKIAVPTKTDLSLTDVSAPQEVVVVVRTDRRLSPDDVDGARPPFWGFLCPASWDMTSNCCELWENCYDRRPDIEDR